MTHLLGEYCHLSRGISILIFNFWEKGNLFHSLTASVSLKTNFSFKFCTNYVKASQALFVLNIKNQNNASEKFWSISA